MSVTSSGLTQFVASYFVAPSQARALDEHLL